MQKKWFVVTAFCTIMGLIACLHPKPKTTVAKIIDEYKQNADSLSAELQQFINLIQNNASPQQLQQEFRKARAAYKKVEWLAAYYYPYTAKKINGPALAEVEPDEKSIIIKPEGFQVIEEMVFLPDHADKKMGLLQQAKILHSNIGRLQYLVSLQETTDAHVFDALRLEMFRVITLGISGFDSPVAKNSLSEAAISLEGVWHNFSFYEEKLTRYDKHLNGQLNLLFRGAIKSLSFAKDFNSFDRLKLITQYLNPCSEKLLLAQQVLEIPLFTEPRVLRANAKTLFSENIFNPDFYAPNTDSYSNPGKIKLGEKLFYDGILSGDGKRSCATCHQPDKAFTDGLTTSSALGGKRNIRRNAPTLINAALQPSLFFDTRVNYLEDQANEVINNEDEMHGSLEAAVNYINQDSTYKELFKNAYSNEEVSGLQIKNSIAAYIRSLIKMNSRFDQYMRGRYDAMNQMEIDGFNLFMGKAKCGTCHFIPLFNGSNPPAFDKIDAEVIGVPGSADTLRPVLDTDQGKYDLYKVILHKNAFKTPTLRNIVLTSPYMHNGVFKALEEVVEFYNRGGGSGLGLKLDNQTLPGNKLDLTAYEKKSLVAFMGTLTDTSSAEEPKTELISGAYVGIRRAN